MKEKMNSSAIKPYGDLYNDGMMQLSFTLPVGPAIAEEAARQLAASMGLTDIRVVFHNDIGNEFTFVIVYGRCTHSVDVSLIHVDKAVDMSLSFDEINSRINQKLQRKIVVVGACIESDAHTVGIDAILNMKGFHGNYGLERYSGFDVVNMGAQVPAEELIKKARETNADAILVSQIVTQQNIHLHNLTKLIDLLEAENIRNRFLVIVGGPSIDNKFAKELGYDAGFGRGTVASQVATFIVKRIVGEGDELRIKN